jgi:ABC-type multidrug transport system ATPase subunit
MNITLNNVGRRFNKEWIFKNIDFSFTSSQKYAVLGPNGSGKSTLLNILLGSLTPSEGEINFNNPEPVQVESVYKHLSFAAPYLDLIEDFSLLETINFNFKFKPYVHGFDADKIVELLGMEKSKDKLLKNFSSGMKQRTKLALALCAATPILILDEPTSNLDQQGIDWYLNLIERFGTDKLIIVGSNQKHEYEFCNNQLLISDYK